MKKQTTNKYYVLTLLICLFAAPGIAAYVFYNHPSWLGGTRVNKGVLLSSPVELTSVAGKTKWRLIFWSPSTCAKACLKQLDILARVRLALGRKFYQVDQQLVLGMDSFLSSAMKKKLEAKDFKVHKLSDMDIVQLKNLSEQPHVFIMDPNNYLVLSYKSGVNPDDIYKDLKLLLNTSEIKKG
jgi:hypothetical protein